MNLPIKPIKTLYLKGIEAKQFLSPQILSFLNFYWLVDKFEL